jgi:Tfp pilus assembly protein PilF
VHAGRSLVAAGRPLAGVVYLQKAFELEPRQPLVQYELAKALASAGLNRDARSMLEGVLRERPDHADALNLLAALAASEGDLDSTVRWFVRAQAAHPSDPERFRTDARFDPVRNDPRFLEAVRCTRLPALFAEARPR